MKAKSLFNYINKLLCLEFYFFHTFRFAIGQICEKRLLVDRRRFDSSQIYSSLLFLVDLVSITRTQHITTRKPK